MAIHWIAGDWAALKNFGLSVFVIATSLLETPVTIDLCVMNKKDKNYEHRYLYL